MCRSVPEHLTHTPVYVYPIDSARDWESSFYCLHKLMIYGQTDEREIEDLDSSSPVSGPRKPTLDR